MTLMKSLIYEIHHSQQEDKGMQGIGSARHSFMLESHTLSIHKVARSDWVISKGKLKDLLDIRIALL